MIKYFGISGVVAIAIFVIYSQSSQDEHVIHIFEKIQLSSTFYGEGAGIGDIDGNGHPDVVCGPYWYEGPKFENRQAYYTPQEFDPLQYSDNFIIEVDDVNGNGLNDILVIGFPGQEAFWYENPGNEEDEWTRYLIHPTVDNESPAFLDMTGDGNLELVFHTDGYIGYAAPNLSDPTKPWTFTSISEQGEWGHFHHGFGVGDVNGDGYNDFLMSEGWWENPGSNETDESWQHHEVDFGPGGAQMHTYDIDGDGKNDVISAREAHGWGLDWYKNIGSGNEIKFERKIIMGDSFEDNPYGVRFSQPHSLALADMDNNGLNGLLSGKRYWAHGPEGDPEPNAPAVIYWFKLQRTADGEVDFIPYLIDDNSGAGVDIATGDLTGNGYPDIATCNKQGGYVFLNKTEKVSRDEWQSVQPKRIGD